MDELKQLKKDWQKDKKFPKINKSEIYKFFTKNPLQLSNGFL